MKRMHSLFVPGVALPGGHEIEPASPPEPIPQTGRNRARSVAGCLLGLVLVTSGAHLPAAPGDENWDDRFGRIGGGGVGAVVLAGTNLCAGGNFEPGTARTV